MAWTSPGPTSAHPISSQADSIEGGLACDQVGHAHHMLDRHDSQRPEPQGTYEVLYDPPGRLEDRPARHGVTVAVPD